MYNHFSDKADLAREALERHHQRVIAAITHRIAHVQGSDAQLMAVFDWHGRGFRTADFRGCIFDRALKDYDIVDPVLSEVAIRHKKATRDLIADVLRSELPSSRQAQALAMAIVMPLDGATASAYAFHDSAKARRAWHAAQVLVGHARPTGD
ncbi:TetR/AcrR family transcriptional regulator [Burkholderia cenocepacia]|nr:TetR/AcrR family transcriptional regulator [Burkholderia cenocepacia]